MRRADWSHLRGLGAGRGPNLDGALQCRSSSPAAVAHSSTLLGMHGTMCLPVGQLFRCPECGRIGRQGHAGWCPTPKRPLPLVPDTTIVRIPSKRVDLRAAYPRRSGRVSPVSSGSDRTSLPPPGSVLVELPVGPSALGVMAISTVIRGHIAFGVVLLIFTMIMVVQAVIDVPRALEALRAAR